MSGFFVVFCLGGMVSQGNVHPNSWSRERAVDFTLDDFSGWVLLSRGCLGFFLLSFLEAWLDREAFAAHCHCYYSRASYGQVRFLTPQL